MAQLRFSPGLLSSIREFGSTLTDAPSAQAGARGSLTGAGAAPASLGGMLARNVGGLMGRDMRTSGEKLESELNAIENPLSPEGMLQKAQVYAKMQTPQAQALAVSLATEARSLKESQELKERTEKGRQSRIDFFEKKGDKETVALIENFGIGDKAADALIAEYQTEEIGSKLDSQGKVPKRNAKKAFIKTVEKRLPKGMAAEVIADIESGSYDTQDYKDFTASYSPTKMAKKAKQQNWVVQNKIGDDASGTTVRAFAVDEEGNLFNEQQQAWVPRSAVGAIRLAGVGKEAEQGEGPDIKAVMGEQAAGFALNIVNELSNLDSAERTAALAMAGGGIIPTAVRTVSGRTDVGKAAGQIKNSRDRIVSYVSRTLSGAQIRKDEKGDFEAELTPTFSDFNDNNLLFSKMANTYVGLEVARGAGFKDSSDPKDSQDNADALRYGLNELAETPITPEIQELVDKGEFRKALDLRLEQMTGRGKMSVDSLMDRYK